MLRHLQGFNCYVNVNSKVINLVFLCSVIQKLLNFAPHRSVYWMSENIELVGNRMRRRRRRQDSSLTLLHLIVQRY